MIGFPADFQPGDRLVKTVTPSGETWTWERGSVPAPLPIPPLRVMPQADYQSPNLRALGKLVFPIPGLAFGQALWNVPCNAMPVHAKSGTWLATIGSGRPLHPDFGSAAFGAGIPINVVSSAQLPIAARRPVKITTYAAESDLLLTGYPVPDGAYVEKPTDSHLIVVDKDDWLAWEFFNFQVENGTYTAEQVTAWDLSKDDAHPRGWTSADASGCAILPGLVRYDEASAGAIKHALRWTCSPTDHAFVPPASHYAATVNTAAPPMGARLRLKANANIDTVPRLNVPTGPRVRAILQAMKTYGLVLADNGSTGYVTGCPDSRWDDDELAQLKEYILGRDFEFVDTGIAPVTSV